jgi:hypothetical protein
MKLKNCGRQISACAAFSFTNGPLTLTPTQDKYNEIFMVDKAKEMGFETY